MRQRITFIHKPGNGVPFEALEVSDAGVKGPEIEAVREDRVTLALEELPAELSQLLSESHELHIRWVTPETYETVTPLNSRVSPGFHLFYTPKKEGQWDAWVFLSCHEKLYTNVISESNSVKLSAMHLGPADALRQRYVIEYELSIISSNIQTVIHESSE